MKARIRRVVMNPLAFMGLMAKDTVWRVHDGIPSDADLRGFTIDSQTQNLILFVEHPSFAEVDVQHEVAPLLVLEVRKVK